MAGQSRPKELLFVFHGQKQSKRSQELQDARRRAHAARQSARKNKDLSHDANKPNKSEPPSHNGPELPVVESTLRGPVRRYPALPSIEALLGHDDSDPVHASGTTLSPLSILSQDLTDPFQTTVIATLPVVLQRYLHDAQTMIWPSLVPLVPQDQATYFYRRSPVDSPSEIDHQIDAAAAISLQYVRSNDPVLLAQIAAVGRKHRNQSIEWVNSKVANASGPPPSNVVAALLSLVSHSGLQKPCNYTRYRQSPLVMGEFSSLFGASRVLSEDMRFLYQVVELKGGDQWVGSDTIDQDLPLRLMLNHFDIFVATRKGQPPMWHAIAAVPPSIMEKYSKSPVVRGRSPTRFAVLISNPPLRDAILTVRTALKMLDLYATQAPTAPSFSLLVHMRMIAQHQLLMLYPEPERPVPSSPSSRLSPGTRLHGLDAIAHAAALIFNDLVLFVLPPASGTRPRLLRELKAALAACPPAPTAGAEESGFRVWALMMLGCGSITWGDVDEVCVTELSRQKFIVPAGVEEGPESWARCKAAMASFLWWDEVLALPAWDVWMEAARRRRGGTPGSTGSTGRSA